MNVLSAADRRKTMPEVRRLVGQVLDSIDITDVVYYEFMFARPLIEDMLFRIVNLVEPGGKVLVIGGNSLLCHAVVAAGYDLHLWRFGENLLSGELDKYTRGTVTPDQLKTGQLPFGAERYDGMLLPLVLELVPEYPQPVLKALRKYLRRDGVLVTATRNLAVLGTRTRALMGKKILPEYRTSDVFFSVNWPDMQAQRYYIRPELTQAAYESGYTIVEAEYVVGRTVYEADPLFGITGWASRVFKHALKNAVPSLRDYIMLTLRHPTAQELRIGVAKPVEGEPVPEDPLSRQPTVTIVVPTHNRSAWLQDCFAGLKEQTYPTDRFDVILVNDGCVDDTDEVAVKLIMEAPFKVHYLRTPGIGAVGARNLGMREATGEIVGHLDDDNRPIPEWIEEAVRAFQSPDVALVGGPVIPKPEQTPPPYLSFYGNLVEDNGIYPTSNIFYRRQPAIDLGGFDESFGGQHLGRPIAGWDSDIAWRLRRAGYAGRYRQGVTAYQEVVSQSPVEWVQEGWRVTNLPMAVKRVPELGEHMLDHQIFLHGYSRRYDAFLLGLGLAIWKRNPLPLVLTLPWVSLNNYFFSQHRWPPKRWPLGIAKASILILRQGVTLAALIRGGVKAKRVIL